MATMQLPAIGYGLRYEFGIFRQSITDGWQREQPDNWLRRPDPVGGGSPARGRGKFHLLPRSSCGAERCKSYRGVTRELLIGIPFDRPVVGYGGKTINTLHILGRRRARTIFDFQRVQRGELIGALGQTLADESLYPRALSRRLSSIGKRLRFVQEYFLVACSLADLVRRFRRSERQLVGAPEKVAIQLNDTHPTMAVPELMRILLDEASLG